MNIIELKVRGRSHLSHCASILYKSINAVCVVSIREVGKR